MSRTVALMVAVAVVLAAFVPSGPRVSAQTKDDVSRAEQEANRAKAELQQAQSTLDAASAARAQVEAELLAQATNLERVSAELDTVAARVIELRGEIEDAELEVSRLRGFAEERAVEAYMGAWSMDIGVMTFASSSFTEALMLQDVAESVRSEDLATINELTIKRRVLDELRTEFEADQARLQQLQGEAAEQVDLLEQLFAQADSEVRAAYLTVDAADRAYRSAQSGVEEAKRAYQAAQRKLRIGSGVTRWRPLVEKYFPPELVDQALSVMQCESGGNPDATNRYSGAAGLFQFLKGTWAVASVRAGFAGYSRYDPEANIAAAAWLVDYSIRTNHPRGAWGHWSCQPR